MATPPPLPKRRSREYVLVPKDELAALLEYVRRHFSSLDPAAAARAEVSMLVLARALVPDGTSIDPDKTPIRPPSERDMRAAYRTSSEFSPKSGLTEPQPFRVEVQKTEGEPQGHRILRKPPIPREE